MMNQTISALVIQSLAKSPLLLSSRAAFQKNIQFDKVIANNFVSNFFKTCNTRDNIQFKSSKFNKFLNSAISFQSISLYNISFTNGYSYNGDSVLNITRCTFTKCSNVGGIGGAVSIPFPQDSYPQIQVHQCIFRDCRSDRGGALFIGGTKVDLSETCISRCIGDNAHHAVAAYTTSKKCPSTTTLCSIFCCPNNYTGGDNVISVFRNSPIIASTNSTYNRFHGDGCFVASIGLEKVMVSYSFFGYNLGDDGFYSLGSNLTRLFRLQVFNNTVDSMFVSCNQDNSKKHIIYLVYTEIERSNYDNRSISHKLNIKYNINIINCRIDRDTAVKVKKDAISISASGILEQRNVLTSFFYDRECEFNLVPSPTRMKGSDMKISYPYILIPITIVAVIIPFVLIFISIRSKALQEEWMLAQQDYMKTT